MSKKRATRAPGKTATAAAEQDPSSQGPSLDNSTQAAALAGKDPLELADEKAADTLAYKVVRQMHADGGDLRQADPRSEYIPPALAAAFQAITGQDVSETQMWTSGADKRAEELGASAFAQDEEIWMPMSTWKPTDPQFELLIAHEVAHVVLNHVPVGSAIRQRHKTVANIGFVKRGSRGNGVRDLQNALVNMGFMSAAEMATGPGVFGRKTHAALLAFQSRHGLTVDGIFGPQSQGKLLQVMTAAHNTGETRTTGDAGRGTVGFTGRPVVRSRDEGIHVKAVQRLLNSHGATLQLDGEYGPKTGRALRAFQSANGLNPDGIAGPDTAAKLNDANANAVPASANVSGDTVGNIDPNIEVDVDDGDPRNILRDSRINPDMRKVVVKTLTSLQQQGLSPYVISGFRSFEKQNDLYAQGRSKPGNKVTWVTGGGSWHNYGLAVDIAFWDRSHRTVTWDAPNAHWTAIGNAGLDAGMTRWLGPQGDRPHLEYHPNWGNSASTLRDTHSREGLQGVWDRAT